MTLTIVTDPVEILPARIGQEHIRARIQPGLSAALEPATQLRVAGISRLGVTLTRRSTSFGRGFDVVTEPSSAMRAMPGHVRQTDKVGRELEQRRPHFAR
jgi:hypothetical protein